MLFLSLLFKRGKCGPEKPGDDEFAQLGSSTGKTANRVI